MEPHHKSSNKLQSKKRSAATREMQLEEQIIVLKKELQSNNEKYKEMLSKKDGHITALENDIQKSREQHKEEIGVLKQNLQSEFARLHESLIESVNDKVNLKLQSHLHEQSGLFQSNMELIVNKIDNLDQKVDSERGKGIVSRPRKRLFNSNVQSIGLDRNRTVNGEVIRFVEDSSGGVLVSPTGEAVTCSSVNGGGAKLNFFSKEKDSGAYEWKFEYSIPQGSGNIFFGYCSKESSASTWNLDHKDSCLWNPMSGEKYTNAKTMKVCDSIELKEKTGTLRFVLDLDDKKRVVVYANDSDTNIRLWHNGPAVRYPCVAFGKNAKFSKVTLVSFKKLI
eukprot:TRINITY_DN8240_c0_g1_i2.p1 TRINITY_DN8240_c0_g1~~TRINITY_DN8240_c0_g1_i2.p1  ORF type:complete len:337 (-),score=66.67 TRINITY_DN8240_c0_g1_i2:311-1321(-)